MKCVFLDVAKMTEAMSVLKIVDLGLLIFFLLVVLASCYHPTYARFQMLLFSCAGFVRVIKLVYILVLLCLC